MNGMFNDTLLDCLVNLKMIRACLHDGIMSYILHIILEKKVCVLRFEVIYIRGTHRRTLNVAH